MKFEVISENVIKVTLSADDMAKWNISHDNLTPANPKSNEIFWDILHMASEETGIDFENCKLTIEAMQKNDGTFIIFITKKQFSPVEEQKRYRYRKAKGKPLSSDSVLVYLFDDFNHICRFAKNNLYYCLLFESHNTLYKHNDKYCLVVNIPAGLKSFVRGFSSSISEYASLPSNSLLYSSYLGEHCRTLIADNCLKILYDNF